MWPLIANYRMLLTGWQITHTKKKMCQRGRKQLEVYKGLKNKQTWSLIILGGKNSSKETNVTALLMLKGAVSQQAGNHPAGSFWEQG